VVPLAPVASVYGCRLQTESAARRYARDQCSLRAHGFSIDELAEPRPTDGWSAERPDAARLPVFLVARAVRR